MTGLKKWIALFLAGAMLLTGCSAQKSADSGQQTSEETGKTMETAQTEKSMGRYLETEISLPEEIMTMGSFPTAYMQRLDSGELALVEQVAGLYVSGDKGETWEHKEMPGIDELRGKCYMSQIALAPNGAAVVIYSSLADDMDTSETEDSEYKYKPEYLYIDAKGNTKPIEFGSSDNYINQFWFGKDSRLYAYDMEHNVYEVDAEAGTMKELFETEGLSDYVCFTEKYMIVFTSRELAIYDMDTGMMSDEDTVFQKFVEDNLGDRIGSYSDAHSIVAVEGEEENVIYFAFDGGLYRHVIGGTAMEQIVNGDISSFGDPMMSLQSIAVLPDNEFAVLYSGVKLCRYVYDPNVPTVPDQQIGVYSLQENYTIRQAVSLFQKKNPDVYVRYEVGMSGDDGITSEDAVKNLNTKIMSGSGPDILVLDGLPAESYKEKGILADISTIADSLNGDDALFPNLIDACREDGKIYALPVRFQLPMIAGSATDVSGVTDLGTLADTVEKLREANPEGELLGLKTEEELLHTLGLTCSAAWLDEKGAIDEEALSEFLENARRIYQAEIAGMDPQELEDYRERTQTIYSSGFAGEGAYYATASTNALDIAMGAQKLAVGKVYRLDFDFNMITTLADQEKNFTYAFWQGQVKNGFIPNTMVGVYSNAADNELTMEFFRFLFGRELQDIDLSGGFPMNMASFETFAVCPRGEDFGGNIAITDENGNFFSLDIQWADAEDFQNLKQMVQSVSCIATGDTMIGQTVCEIGPKALNGKSSVEDTVAEIVKKAAIYLAE